MKNQYGNFSSNLWLKSVKWTVTHSIQLNSNLYSWSNADPITMVICYQLNNISDEMANKYYDFYGCFRSF